MSEQQIKEEVAAPSPPAVPRICFTCHFWQVDDHRGSLPEAPWGYCWVGFDPALRLPQRTTTDFATCSRHDYKKATP